MMAKIRCSSKKFCQNACLGFITFYLLITWLLTSEPYCQVTKNSTDYESNDFMDSCADFFASNLSSSTSINSGSSQTPDITNVCFNSICRVSLSGVYDSGTYHIKTNCPWVAEGFPVFGYFTVLGLVSLIVSQVILPYERYHFVAILRIVIGALTLVPAIWGAVQLSQYRCETQDDSETSGNSFESTDYVFFVVALFLMSTGLFLTGFTGYQTYKRALLESLIHSNKQSESRANASTVNRDSTSKILSNVNNSFIISGHIYNHANHSNVILKMPMLDNGQDEQSGRSTK